MRSRSSLGRIQIPLVLGTLCWSAVFTPRISTHASAPQIWDIRPRSAITTPGSKVWIYGINFSPREVVYIGGLQVRITTVLGPTNLVVVTPYLRPGAYHLQIRSGHTIVRSAVTFKSVRAPVDMGINRAEALARDGHRSAAINLLTRIATNSPDPQVRAFVHYDAGQIYFSEGDWWRWAGEAATVFDDRRAGMAVQTSWRYRLSTQLADYYLPTTGQKALDLISANWTVQYDATEDPEPRFYKSLIEARYGNLNQARVDAEFALKADPTNQSYRALLVYVSALKGDAKPLKSFIDDSLTDPRALALLGEAAYVSGDAASARQWWIRAAKIYPLGAQLAYLAGKKHLARGQNRVAESLFAECVAMAPGSRDAIQAAQLLSQLTTIRSRKSSQ